MIQIQTEDHGTICNVGFLKKTYKFKIPTWWHKIYEERMAILVIVKFLLRLKK